MISKFVMLYWRKEKEGEKTIPLEIMYHPVSLLFKAKLFFFFFFEKTSSDIKIDKFFI